ncbi:MAG: alpha/beta hydrolase [Thermoguttaceae bacterium]
MSARQADTVARGFRRSWWIRLASLTAVSLLLAVPALRAQEEEQKDAKSEDKPAAAKNGPPAPEDVTLKTDDGITLKATYYASTNGKESIPVVLLHGYKESRKDYADLAPALQRDLGCAVLVPDLRGHGDSTSGTGGAIEVARMKPADFSAMSSQDMVAIRSFLIDENNGGGKSPRLNLNKLCIVGAGMGATVAVKFAGDDWNQAPAGPWQMGSFTKALVLISPELNDRRLALVKPLADQNVQKQLSILLLVGSKDSPQKLKDAKSIFDKLARFHPLPEESKRKEKQTLYYGTRDTNLQGTKMLTDASLNVPGLIEDFITRRLDGPDAKSYQWKKLRKDPYVKEPGE